MANQELGLRFHFPYAAMTVSALAGVFGFSLLSSWSAEFAAKWCQFPLVMLPLLLAIVCACLTAASMSSWVSEYRKSTAPLRDSLRWAAREELRKFVAEEVAAIEKRRPEVVRG